MNNSYWATFVELIQTPFAYTGLIWGIVPLYFGLLLNELGSSKANFRTAVQSGFSFLWAAAQWLFPFVKPRDLHGSPIQLNAMQPINLFISVLVLVLGVLAMVSGIRRKFPKYCSFLGRTRFSNYFMITIFPIQAHVLEWTWSRVIAIALFAVPAWLVLQFGLMPLRQTAAKK